MNLEERIMEEVRKIVDESKSEIFQTIKKQLSTIELPELVIKNEDGSVEVMHKKAKEILNILRLKIPVYLYGAPGIGKTHLAKQLSSILKIDFYGTGAIQDSYKLLGYKNANGDYQETDFYKAFKNGGLFLFDEFDASAAEAIIAINSALSNGFVDFPNGRVYAHKDFYVIAAGNTNAQDLGNYAARNEIDLATLDRFAFIEIYYDEKLEEQLISNKEIFNLFIKIRQIVKDRKLEDYILCSTRSLLNIELMVNNGINLKKALKMTVFKNTKPEEIREILREAKGENNQEESGVEL